MKREQNTSCGRPDEPVGERWPPDPTSEDGWEQAGAVAPTRERSTGPPPIVVPAMVRSLTPRQQHVIAVVGAADGLGAAARALGISARSLSDALVGISERLGLSGPHELHDIARRYGGLDVAPQPIYGLDHDGRCVFANRLARLLFGYTRDELVGANMHELIHHSRGDGTPLFEADCAIHQTIRNDRQRTVGQDVFWHRDGSPVWASYTVVPELTGDTGIAAAVIFEDISQTIRDDEQLSISHARLELALEAANIVAFQVDLRTGETVRSDNATSILGLGPGELHGYEDFVSLVHPDDRSKVELLGARHLPPGELFEDDIRLVLPDGSLRHFRRRVRVVGDALGKPATLVGVAVDVTDLHDAEHGHRVMLAMSADAFIGMDAQGLITEWNVAAEKIFGYTSRHARGRPLAELIIPFRDRDAHRQATARVLANPDPSYAANPPRLLTAMRADGSEFPLEITLATVPGDGGIAFRAFARDVSERKRMERELAKSALTDRLTGLPNRALLGDRLAEGLRRLGLSGVPLAVFFIGLDHFQVINDSLGHSAGDELLRAVARRLQAVIRGNDTVARFGGDEFVVVREATSSDDAFEVAGRLLDACSGTFAVAGRDVTMSGSIGAVVARRADQDPEDLLRDADAAMRRAKHRGRGRVEGIDDATRRQARERLDLEGELRRALEQEQFRLFYQPIVRLFDQCIVATEAVLRWDHPTRGLVSPAEFVPLAEETGLIVPLGTWVIERGCRQLVEWDISGCPTSTAMSVNVSGRQLAEAELVEVVGNALEAAGMDASRLWLEITESVLMDDLAVGRSIFDALHHIGVSVAVDDFGTGYSSLLRPSQYRVQSLKLDRGFVAGVGTSRVETAIVRSTIDLAHALGLDAIAEGVERTDQLVALRGMRCDLAQGHLWSEALPAGQIARLLLRGNLAP